MVLGQTPLAQPDLAASGASFLVKDLPTIHRQSIENVMLASLAKILWSISAKIRRHDKKPSISRQRAISPDLLTGCFLDCFKIIKREKAISTGVHPCLLIPLILPQGKKE